MRKSILAISAIALLITTSCSSAEPTQSKPAEVSTQRFVISLKNAQLGDNYWKLFQESAAQKAKELGAELTLTNATDVQSQVKALEDEIAHGASGLAVAPFDAQALGEIQKKAKDANIPLILLDTLQTLPEVKVVGTDEEAAGRLAADYVCNPESGILVNEQGLLARNSEAAIITGNASDVTSVARAKGGRWGLEDCNLKIVAEMSANDDEAMAESVTKEIMAEHANLKVLLVTNEAMAVGAAKAAKEAGKSGELVIIGFGATPQLLTAIIDGNMRATIIPNPDVLGARSVESLHMLSDEQSVPDHYDTGTRLVTIENASQYR